MYLHVPVKPLSLYWLDAILFSCVRIVAKPKSNNLNWPQASKPQLPSFKSRCKILFFKKGRCFVHCLEQYISSEWISQTVYQTINQRNTYLKLCRYDMALAKSLATSSRSFHNAALLFLFMTCFFILLFNFLHCWRSISNVQVILSKSRNECESLWASPIPLQISTKSQR